MSNDGVTAAHGSQAELRYEVAGMDCSGCALKIEGAVESFEGAENIQVNYKTQILEFRLDEASTPRSIVEAKIRELGYGVEPRP